MIPAAFDYVRAGSAEEAIRLIGEHGDDAKFLAGGHSLLPLMKLRLAQPSVLVDIGRISDLSYIRDAGDHIAIGALTRHMDSRPVPCSPNTCRCSRTPPVMSATRRCATAAPSAARSLTATPLPIFRPRRWHSARRMSRRARMAPARSPPATSSKGFLETALAADEMLTEIRVPKMQGAGWNFQKFNRRAQDWAIVGVAAWRRNGDSGVGLVNMGSTPILATSVSNALSQGASVADAAQLAAEDAEPQSDLNASPEYRVHLAKVLVRRALEAC